MAEGRSFWNTSMKLRHSTGLSAAGNLPDLRLLHTTPSLQHDLLMEILYYAPQNKAKKKSEKSDQIKTIINWTSSSRAWLRRLASSSCRSHEQLLQVDLQHFHFLPSRLIVMRGGWRDAPPRRATPSVHLHSKPVNSWFRSVVKQVFYFFFVDTVVKSHLKLLCIPFPDKWHFELLGELHT